MKANEWEKKLENTNFTFGFFVKWFFIAAIFFMVIGFIGNTLGLIGTVASVPGKVLKQTLNTDNVIQSYEWFYDVNAAYDARLSQVNQYKGFLNGEDDKAERYRIRTEVAAMQQTCRNLATKYNANSEKMNKSIFKGWSLPDVLSLNDCN